MFIFGLTCNEVEQMWLSGYQSAMFYTGNERLRRAVDALGIGFAGESFRDISSYLLQGYGVADPYMCLADFESYRQAHERALSIYRNPEEWNRMSLMNISGAGRFAADRAITEYAANIWHTQPAVKPASKPEKKAPAKKAKAEKAPAKTAKTKAEKSKAKKPSAKKSK